MIREFILLLFKVFSCILNDGKFCFTWKFYSWDIYKTKWSFKRLNDAMGKTEGWNEKRKKVKSSAATSHLDTYSLRVLNKLFHWSRFMDELVTVGLHTILLFTKTSKFALSSPPSLDEIEKLYLRICYTGCKRSLKATFCFAMFVVASRKRRRTFSPEMKVESFPGKSKIIPLERTLSINDLSISEKMWTEQ